MPEACGSGVSSPHRDEMGNINPAGLGLEGKEKTVP